jgi:hypothetical protein
LLFVGIAYPWLKGYPMAAALMSLAWAPIPVLFMLNSHGDLRPAAVALLVYGVIWAPIWVRVWIKGVTSPARA